MPKAIPIPVVAAEAAAVLAERTAHVASAAQVSRRRFLKDSAPGRRQPARTARAEPRVGARTDPRRQASGQRDHGAREDPLSA